MPDATLTHNTMQPLDSVAHERLAAIRLIATDIDGTLTRAVGQPEGGRLDPRVLEMFAALKVAGVEVLPVTGRPAGEALGLARYLPAVRHALAENGATFVTPDHPVEYLQKAPNRERLLAVAEVLGKSGRPWELAPDYFCRLADLAWLREGRDDAELDLLRNQAREHGLSLVWSNVHIHLSEHVPDKGLGVLEIARRLNVPAHAVATIGDAPNDAGLWIHGRFGLTAGTGQVRGQEAYIPELPMVLVADACEGWLEFAGAVLAAQ